MPLCYMTFIGQASQLQTFRETRKKYTAYLDIEIYCSGIFKKL